jgi:hypothetical protein
MRCFYAITSAERKMDARPPRGGSRVAKIHRLGMVQVASRSQVLSLPLRATALRAAARKVHTMYGNLMMRECLADITMHRFTQLCSF